MTILECWVELVELRAKLLSILLLLLIGLDKPSTQPLDF
jgi:hypothetical protein